MLHVCVEFMNPEVRSWKGTDTPQEGDLVSGVASFCTRSSPQKPPNACPGAPQALKSHPLINLVTPVKDPGLVLPALSHLLRRPYPSSALKCWPCVPNLAPCLQMERRMTLNTLRGTCRWGTHTHASIHTELCGIVFLLNPSGRG